MEQITQFYDNSVSDSIFSLHTADATLGFQETNAIMQSLLYTIDLQQVSQSYFEQVKSRLPLSSMSIVFQDDKLILGKDNNSSNIRTLEFVTQHQVYASIEYRFNQLLQLREWRLLQELHRYFKYPLKNALEHHQLKQLAMKDHLTSLGNRANYTETVQRLLSQFQRNGTPFGLLVLDVDKFKSVNDQFGHSEGDKVLTDIADTLRECLRDTDYAFRFGGDEFCCLLPDSDEQANKMVAARIQMAIQGHPSLSRHALSCSIGGATSGADDNERSVFERADRALYSAKVDGRNRFQAA